MKSLVVQERSGQLHVESYAVSSAGIVYRVPRRTQLNRFRRTRMAGSHEQLSLSETVLKVAREHRPKTVRELAKIAQNRKEGLSEIQVLAAVRDLAETDRLGLLPPRYSNFATYLVNFRWSMMLWTAVALLSVYVVLHF